MIKNNRKLSGIVICLALAGGGWKLFHGEAAKAAPQDLCGHGCPTGNGYESCARRGAHRVHRVGDVQAFNEVTVRPQVSGQIVKIAYKQGQLVQQGALLVQIDPAPFQAKLDQDEANAQRDQAKLANAELDLRRFAPLARKGMPARQQMDTQRSMVARTAPRSRPIKRSLSRMRSPWRMPDHLADHRCRGVAPRRYGQRGAAGRCDRGW